MKSFNERVTGVIIIMYVFVLIGVFAVMLGFAQW